ARRDLLPDGCHVGAIPSSGIGRPRPTRLVGREGERGVLFKALEQARAGRGQIAAVVGEPGVGKSRLFYEILHSHRTHGWLILQSTSVSYGRATAYSPVIELLRSYFKIAD